MRNFYFIQYIFYIVIEISYKNVLKRKAAVIRLQAQKPFGMTAVLEFGRKMGCIVVFRQMTRFSSLD